MNAHTSWAPQTSRTRRLLLGLAMAAAVIAQQAGLSAAGPAVLDLGSTAHFTILSGAAVTSTGGGIITGDVGASPIAGSAIGVTQAQVNGFIYAVDASGPAGSMIAPAMLTTAKGDLTIAYNDAAGRTPVPTGPFLNPGGGNIGGLNLVAGLYKFTSTALITGSDLTLTGGPGDVWIFQIAADLQLGSGIHVILAGGAQARNIFWQVGTSAVLGTYSAFKGTILADQAITLNTGSTMEGRALAFDAGVTFNGDSGSLPAQDALPVAQPNVVSMNQNTTHTFQATDFPFTDAENELLAAVKIETLPLLGSLDYNGAPATVGQLVTPADFAANRLQFTPVANASGSPYTSFSFSVADTVAAGTATAMLTVNLSAVNQAPVAVTDAYSTPESTTLIVPVAGILSNDSDADGDPLTAIKVSDPLHGTLTLNANGSFTYAPVALYSGSDSFSYKANDGTVDSNTVTVSLSVSSVNQAPVAVTDAYSTPESTTLIVPVAGILSNDSDADGDPLTAIKVSDPLHGTLTLNANGSFTYAPVALYSGSDSFSYKANDGTVDSNTVTVSLSVSSINQAPVAFADAYSTPESTTLIVLVAGILSNDSDVDGNPLTAIKVSDPLHGTLTLNANGSFTYAPVALYNGSDSFTYKANDGTVDSNTVTVSLSVSSVNQAPVAVADAYSTPESTTLVVLVAGILSNDSDVDGNPLTAIKVSDPLHGALTLNANGSFTYAPVALYNGSDSFTYKANDGTVDSNTVTVSLSVSSVNQAPVAVANAYSTPESTTLVVLVAGVLSNDSDVDGNPLTAIKVSDPLHGTLTLNANGSFTYVPAALYNGSDSFTYKANDGTVDSNTVTVSLSVSSVNQAPVAFADAYSTLEDTTLIVQLPSGVLNNDTDVDGNPLTAIRVSDPLHGTLTLSANGLFIYSPTLGYHGSDSFTYKANDGTADSNTVTVSVSISAVNHAPVAVADAVTTPEDTRVNIAVSANDTDADGDPLTIIGTTAPRHGTVLVNPDGTILYTPEADYFGQDTFTYTISDGQPPTGSTRSVRGIRGAARQPSARSKATDSATVTITVTSVEDGPRWYPHIPWAPVTMGNGNDYEWYNFEIWDGVPDALGAHKVLETNVHGLAMTTAEEYFMAGSDGLLPGTYQWRYRTWVPETDVYGTAWRPGSGGQTLTIEYGLPALPTGLTCVPNPGASGNLTLSFVAGNAQGYDLEITGTLPQNNQVLHGAYFMPGADRVVPYDWVTSRAVTLAGPDTCTWRIRGFNPSGTSAWSRGPDITVGGGPRDPMPEVPDYRTMRPVDAWVVTALEGTSSIAFQWNSVPGAAGYLVYLSSASGVPILNYIDVGNVTRVDSIAGTRIALPPGNYVWCLLAYNAAQPREYGGWNHSSRTPTQESPIFFQVIADLRAPTITSAFRDEAANTVRIGWVGTAPATVDLLLFYSAAARWLDIRNQPVTATGESTGTVTLGQHAWGPGANYLLLTGKTATGTAGPRSRLFLLP